MAILAWGVVDYRDSTGLKKRIAIASSERDLYWGRKEMYLLLRGVVNEHDKRGILR